MTAPIRRRTFLKLAAAGAVVGLSPSRVSAQGVIVVGLVRPPERGALGDGAALGLDDANALATMFNRQVRLVGETAADGPAAGAAARALVKQGAIAIVGGPGAGHADALRDVTAAAQRLFFNAGAHDDALRGARCDRHSFHLVPSVSMGVDALTQWLAGPRKQRRWALVTDGSPRGREIEAATQRAAGRLGASLSEDAKAADMTLLAVDTTAHRETAARLRAAGTPFAGIGVDLGVEASAGEAGGFWVVGWHHQLERFSARELNRKFRRRFNAGLDETSWAAWAALKLVGEASVRGNVTDAAGLRAYLGTAQDFDGHKGVALTFRPWDQQLRQPVYVIGPRSGEGKGQGPFEVLAQAPREDLDTIGIGLAETRCQEGKR